MAKVRIYELAKELNLSSKEMVGKLNELGFAVKSALNSVDQETADKMVDLLVREEKAKKPKKKPKKKPAAKKKRSSAKAAGAGVKTNRICLAGPVLISDFAQMIGIKSKVLLKKLRKMGSHNSVNDEISLEEAVLLADEYGFQVEEVPLEMMGLDAAAVDSGEELPRPPVVAVLGHVDHGKTSLLDFIRKSRVAAREDGGITQHIGAYQVMVNGQPITFIDTPGHAAFTAMRARGAHTTDIVILIVAADDGVMPQTVEAINHAKAADVPIIVAVNKIDKDNANPARVRQDLMQHELLAEELGGDTIFVDISAKTGHGIDDLLEMLMLQAEIMELTANPNLPARGVVLESRLDKGRGPMASVLIQRGTLKVGDYFIAGTNTGKVRAMMDDRGTRVTSAGPSRAVEVIGLAGVPQPGDALIVVPSERQAKRICMERQQEEVEKSHKDTKAPMSLDDLFSMMSDSQKKEFRIIIKADVQGSLEAINDVFKKLKSDKIDISIIHQGVGTIADTDVNLASTSNAMIIGYRVKPTAATANLAHQMSVEIRLYRVIYELLEEIEKAMKGMLDPEFKEVDLGTARIKEIFPVQKVGNVAGCIVESGKIARDALVRVLRDGILVYEGKLDSLKHYKDAVKEVVSGQECGMHIENFNDIKVGDVIEAYTRERIEAEL